MAGLALAVVVAARPPALPPDESKTLKERLSDKASDEQRVDNCRVPVERRGPTPRPGCPTGAPATSPTATPPAQPR